MVWPTANRLVTTARPLPQALRGRLAFTKLVAAAGTIKTLAPTNAAEAHTPAIDGITIGRAAPKPNTAMVDAMGTPSARPLKTRFQSIGANRVITPSALHMIDVTAAGGMPSTGFWRSQAMMNVM